MAKDGIFSSIIPIAVLGGVGYWLYESGVFSSLFGSIGGGSASNPPLPPTNPSNPVSTPTPIQVIISGGTAQVNTPPPTNGVVPTGSLKDRMLNYMTANPSFVGGSSTKTFDQWNWLVSQVGAPSGLAIEDVFPGAPRDTQYYLDGFLAGMATKGISGIGKGLGMIMDWNGFFSSQPHKKCILGNFR